MITTAQKLKDSGKRDGHFYIFYYEHSSKILTFNTIDNLMIHEFPIIIIHEFPIIKFYLIL